MDSLEFLEVLDWCGDSPAIPIWERGYRDPQSKLASKTSYITKLWFPQRDPASLNKAEEQMKMIPGITLLLVEEFRFPEPT